MKEIIMPKLGLTMEEGLIISWLKGEGDQVEKGEILFEVETDKAVNEVPSSYTGTVGKIFVGENEVAEVLSVIGYILEPGEEVPEEWPRPGKTQEVKFEVGKRPDVAIEKTGINASQEALEVAEEKGIDLGTIQGTGPNGMVIKEDVLAVFKQRDAAPEKKPIKVSPRARRLAEEKDVPLDKVVGSGPEGRIVEDDVKAFINQGQGKTINKFKRITADRMTNSFTTTPHFYLTIDVNASKLVDLRKRLLQEIEAQTGLRITYSDLFVYLVSRVIKKHPLFNASWDNGELQYAETTNIGLAVAVESGLVVPVIRSADVKDLNTIVKERSDLVEKAKSNRLSLEELESGTFTITNLGMFGIDSFSAIINPPQSAIFAIGCIKDRVVPVEDNTSIAPFVSMTLTLDHRVMDGIDGARFLKDLREVVESPEKYMLKNKT